MNGYAPAVTDAETRPLLTALATTSAVVVACVLLTHWPTYHHHVLGGPEQFMYYVMPGFFAFVLAFIQPSAPLRLLDEPLLLWFLAFVISGLAWLLLAQDFPEQAGIQWRLRVWSFFFFATILLISSLARRSSIALAIVGLIVFAAALNWYDVLHPLTLVPRGVRGSNPGRGAGFFINANGAAAFILMATIAVVPYIRMRWRGALLVLAVVGIAPTFSRFGLIFVALLIGLAVVFRLIDRRQVVMLLIASPILIAGAGIYYEFIVASGNQNVLGRLAWFETLGSIPDPSVREREYVAHQAWLSFLESPFFGNGIAATVSLGQPTGTHNMYLLLMAEQGLFGLALWLSFIGVLAYRGWRLMRTALYAVDRDIGCAMLMYATFLTLYGMVSHNVLEEPHGMFILAFLAASAFHAAERTRDAAAEIGTGP